MPRLPIDYSRTIIYKLVHKDDLDDVNVYVGHTTDFTKRKNLHKKSCNSPSNKEYNTKKYQFIRENGGWGEWEMLKIEDYPCKDVYEAKNRERYWIKELKPKLNIYEPLRTGKEYYEDNKERIAEYRENNREKIRETKKEYHEKNKEQITEYYKEWCENNKEKIKENAKEYYEDNKDKILEKVKEYREKNKEKIAKYKKEYREKNKEKIECDKCGCEIMRGSLLRHKRTKKCQNYGSQ